MADEPKYIDPTGTGPMCGACVICFICETCNGCETQNSKTFTSHRSALAFGVMLAIPIPCIP
jgi:hypothetical protein